MKSQYLIIIAVLCITCTLSLAEENIDSSLSDVRIVPRSDWKAQSPVEEPTKLTVLPPAYVIISHTATNVCHTQAQCTYIVRTVQTFHIESRGWNDIAYNFLVGGDGSIYEGRGWDIEGAHSRNYNSKSIGVSFIGTFNVNEPTDAQVEAAKQLLEFGVKEGKISQDYKLLGHRQTTKTESPGNKVYNIIKKWKHWSPNP